jgi:NADH-quinone oxidoreductase subunit N
MPGSSTDTLLLLPELFLTAAGLALLLYATVVKREHEARIAFLSIASLAATGLLLGVSASLRKLPFVAFGGMFTVDRFAIYFKALVLLAAVATIVYSLRFVGASPYPAGEYYGLIVFTTVGMMFMASGTHLASIYIALELMALSQYVLAGYFKQETKSIEAGAKYFVLGAFSSGVLLYGLSLVYGATGTLALDGIAKAFSTAGKSPLLVVGIILTACGLFFKVASAPFHVWAPDVYEGAPTPISAFFAVGPKLAAYAIFARIFFSGFGARSADWSAVVAASAALTMIVGNVGALMQTNVKRMLGYSSIGHAGYALLGLLAYGVGPSGSEGGSGAALGLQAILIYMAAYLLMNLGAFGLVILLESKGYAGESVDDFNGLAKKNPLAAAAMLVFLLSLAGIPPTAGFIGKWFLFAAAMKAGWMWLTVLAVLMSAVSLFYYFRIARAMYLVEGEGELTLREQPLVGWAIAVCLAGTLAIGVFPQPIIAFAKTCLLP